MISYLMAISFCAMAHSAGAEGLLFALTAQKWKNVKFSVSGKQLVAVNTRLSVARQIS